MNLPINGLGPSPSPRDYPIQPEPALSGKPLSSSGGGQGTGQDLAYGGVSKGQVDFTPMSEKRQVQSTDPADPQSGQNAAGGGLSSEIMSLLQKLIEMLNQMMGNSEGANGKGDKSSGGSGSGGPGPISNKQAVTPQAPQGPSSPEASGAPAQAGNGPVGKTDSTGGVASTANADKAPQGMPQELWKDCVAAGNKHGVDPLILAAQAKKESDFGANLNGASGGDGVMQVEPNTRAAHADEFRQKAGHDYDHSSQSDQVEMAAMIMSGKGGDTTNQLTKYNGGDNWTPGASDSYGRVIEADKYAASVQQIAAELKASVA
jgi:hypothetical protein